MDKTHFLRLLLAIRISPYWRKSDTSSQHVETLAEVAKKHIPA
jgi:hypothetical protein